MDAFDADVLILCARRAERAAPVTALFESGREGPVGTGSLILLLEARPKPLRTGHPAELLRIDQLLGRLELFELTARTARLGVDVAARYGLRAADAIHLATAVEVGADRFITNNRRDFPKSIEELEITYPEDLVASAR